MSPDISSPTSTEKSRFLSPYMSPTSPGSKPFYPLPSTRTTNGVLSDTEGKYILRQGDMALKHPSFNANTNLNGVNNRERSKTPRPFRRRSNSDTGPSRPFSTGSNSTTSGEFPMGGRHNNGSPLTPTSPKRLEYYDLITTRRSDRGRNPADLRTDASTTISSNSSGSTGTVRQGAATTATAGKGKKKAWRNRLRAVTTSSVATSSSSRPVHPYGGGGSRSAGSRSRMQLWATSPTTKTFPTT